MAGAAADIDIARERMREAVSRFRGELVEIENILHTIGPPPQVPGVTPAVPVISSIKKEIPRLLMLHEITAAPSIMPSSFSLAQGIYELVTIGFKERSYDVMDTVIAPQPVTPTGAVYDAELYYDAWIVLSTVDTRISFTAPPSVNTPVLPAGLTMNFQLRAKKIYYTASTPNTSGTLSLWLARYA